MPCTEVPQGFCESWKLLPLIETAVLVTVGQLIPAYDAAVLLGGSSRHRNIVVAHFVVIDASAVMTAPVL